MTYAGKGAVGDRRPLPLLFGTAIPDGVFVFDGHVERARPRGAVRHRAQRCRLLPGHPPHPPRKTSRHSPPPPSPLAPPPRQRPHVPRHRRQRPPGQRRLLLGHLWARRRQHAPPRRHTGTDHRRRVRCISFSLPSSPADPAGAQWNRRSIPHGCAPGISHGQVWPQDVGVCLCASPYSIPDV